MGRQKADGRPSIRFFSATRASPWVEAFANLGGKRAGGEEWTREIKTQLCLAGAAQQPPLHVRASRVEEADNGEWMHGVCWLRYGEDLDCLNEVALTLECERGGAGADSGRIRDGFHKLLVGRARVRCMIWKDGNRRDDPAVVEWLAGMTDECVETAPNDLYLLARHTAYGFQ